MNEKFASFSPSALIVSWARNFYEFSESELATVELITTSKFEAAQINILARPVQIPDGHPNHYPPLMLPQQGLNGMETQQPNRSSLYRMYDSFLNPLPVKGIFLIARM